jgi:hypothetical protein
MRTTRETWSRRPLRGIRDALRARRRCWGRARGVPIYGAAEYRAGYCEASRYFVSGIAYGILAVRVAREPPRGLVWETNTHGVYDGTDACKVTCLLKYILLNIHGAVVATS